MVIVDFFPDFQFNLRWTARSAGTKKTRF